MFIGAALVTGSVKARTSDNSLYVDLCLIHNIDY